jgi:stress response protein SCP2
MRQHSKVSSSRLYKKIKMIVFLTNCYLKIKQKLIVTVDNNEMRQVSFKAIYELQMYKYFNGAENRLTIIMRYIEKRAFTQVCRIFLILFVLI